MHNSLAPECDKNGNFIGSTFANIPPAAILKDVFCSVDCPSPTCYIGAG